MYGAQGRLGIVRLTKWVLKAIVKCTITRGCPVSVVFWFRMIDLPLPHRPIHYTEDFLHIHTHTPLHKKTFTQKNAYGSFYTQKNLRTETFTHRSVYGAANRNFHAELLLPRAAFTHTHVYTQKFSNTKAFAHGSVYGAQNLLDREAFTHRNFDTEKSLYGRTFTHRRV